MSDCILILNELKRGPITSDQMWRWHGIQRCGARIYDLRKSGFEIDTIRRTVTAVWFDDDTDDYDPWDDGGI